MNIKRAEAIKGFLPGQVLVFLSHTSCNLAIMQPRSNHIVDVPLINTQEC